MNLWVFSDGPGKMATDIYGKRPADHRLRIDMLTLTVLGSRTFLLGGVET